MNSPHSTKRFWDYEHIAYLCTLYMTELFGSGLPPPSVWQSDFSFYVGCILLQSNAGDTVAFGALNLLHCYKERRPTTVLHEDEPYRLFLAAYIVSFKVLTDRSLSMEKWRNIALRKFAVSDIAKMERDFCDALDWNLDMDPVTMDWFQVVAGATLPMR